MNNENFLFNVRHPYTSGKYGGWLTLLRMYCCLSLSRENTYNIYIVDDFIHSYKSDKISLFLKSCNSYTIYTHRYRPLTFLNLPDLNVNIYDKIIYITYFLDCPVNACVEYSFSLTGEKMTIFLRNIENCYTKFNELNGI